MNYAGLAEQVLAGECLSRDESLSILQSPDEDILDVATMEASLTLLGHGA